MCIQIMPHYTKCGHNATSDPDRVISFFDACNPYDSCPGIFQRVEEHNGSCPSCLGAVPPRKKEFYKHCFYSLICSHEYDHIITDAERDPSEPDTVLITPEPFFACQDCRKAGFDKLPGGWECFRNTPSRMPKSFEGLERVDIGSVGATVRSRMPSSKAAMEEEEEDSEEAEEEEGYESVLAKSRAYKGKYSAPPPRKESIILSTIARRASPSQPAPTPLRAEVLEPLPYASLATGSGQSSFPSAVPAKTEPPRYRTHPPEMSGGLGLPRRPSEFHEEWLGK